MKLSDSLIGKTVRIVGYSEQGQHHYRQKLLAMGLTPGTVLRIKRIAPMGDPIQLEIRGYDLSIRKQEAAILEVSLCSE